MPTSVNRFDATLRDLEQAVVAIRRFSTEPIDPSLLAKACADAQRCLTVFGDVLEGRSTSSLESFFSAVGAGVISAQRELDKQSIEYIQDTIQQYAAPAATPSVSASASAASAAGVGGQAKRESSPDKTSDKTPDKAPDWNTLSVPPNAAMFRIPRVTAEFKFAVEQTLTKGINIIFYSNKVESQSLQQQTATIEVVSVPLPPNYRPPAPAPASTPPTRTLDAVLASSPTPSESRSTSENRSASESRPASESWADKLGVSDAANGSMGPAASSTPAQNKAQPKKAVIFVDDNGSNDGEDGSQSTVQAVVSTPAPVEQVAAKHRLRLPLVDPFTQALQARVLDEAARADLFARIVPTIRAMGTAGFAHRRLLNRAVQARVIVLADEGHRYFLLLGRSQPQPQLIVWQFSASPPQLQQLLRLRADPQNPSGLSQACRFLERIGHEQATPRSNHGG